MSCEIHPAAYLNWSALLADQRTRCPCWFLPTRTNISVNWFIQKKYVKKWGQVIPYPDQKKSQVFQYETILLKILWDFVKKFLTYFKILNFISMFWRKTNRPEPILKKSRTIWSKFLTNQNIDFFFFRKTNRPILLKGQSFFFKSKYWIFFRKTNWPLSILKKGLSCWQI